MRRAIKESEGGVKNYDDTFTGIDTYHECDRQTDWLTDIELR